MGTRLYVAGPESFIGLVMKIALEFNLNQDEIRAEECGTLARRVYCIHCRATTENVRTNIVRCVDCERWLLVRDHPGEAGRGSHRFLLTDRPPAFIETHTARHHINRQRRQY
jgi:hypothetical protein